ncbi:IS3 family transposase [Paenalkalicoccus suaedae]|uniref:IS3 family transposase n=1 Tax=Paenalkalicoccus suaedae TaxID=2592382 RepID=A0A859FEP2_9BACI|nr:IS3 family transposase [Paenalkalicoccus suaedae]QKS70010.1 IS3 family transposase [Paenalkalicoccus suaedae]QKS70382.1 IS3 family transposase [Paenalkalicoccus suaedae]QKS71823.1 IS3 family transposase [Paenalkalicoccus suaedae]QKS72368.1 IS3 family transposase [Paenalkalicoccus suaedae]QKS72772.1 IS3 family transposase [Paenalkalicoccus suaedae]
MAFELKEEGYRLKDILVIVGIPESTYHYHVKNFGKEDPDRELKEVITELFKAFHERYGYKRITKELKKSAWCINHKKVYRLMRELGLKCVKFMRKSRRYNSYKGKVGKVAKNRLSRRFSTPIPFQKLVTDITEFKCLGEEKLYLNPLLDLYNGEIIAFGIKKRPTLDLVMEPLKETIEVLGAQATYRTTIHSDQGWHYQHNQWVRTLKENKVFQSMSRKATCADNASIENFFGILKQEMYYGEKLVSYEELKRQIEEYIYWYNHIRSKEKLAGFSPVEYRTQTSQLAA